MRPVPTAETWNLSAIETAAALADLLQVSPAKLDWFADLKGSRYSEDAGPKGRHYHYRARAIRPGSDRFIESPKLRLKEL